MYKCLNIYTYISRNVVEQKEGHMIVPYVANPKNKYVAFWGVEADLER